MISPKFPPNLREMSGYVKFCEALEFRLFVSKALLEDVWLCDSPQNNRSNKLGASDSGSRVARTFNEYSNQPCWARNSPKTNNVCSNLGSIPSLMSRRHHSHTSKHITYSVDT